MCIRDRREGNATVDVLAEIAAHGVPIKELAAHEREADVYQYSVEAPDKTRVYPAGPSTSAVVGQIYRDSGMTYAGRSQPGSWVKSLTDAVSPKNMLATQKTAMEARLMRPLREKEVLAMRQRMKAQAVASLSLSLIHI